jgi:hypothetical protein
MTATKAQRLDISNDDSVYASYCDALTVLAQIGHMNVLAISGGRVLDSGHGVILPVSSGYKVVVDLMGNDTYRVRRIRIVGLKVWLYGERTEVYCDDLADAAYYAGMYKSYDLDEWPTKRS